MNVERFYHVVLSSVGNMAHDLTSSALDGKCQTRGRLGNFLRRDNQNSKALETVARYRFVTVSATHDRTEFTAT
jgi:hypothetical protein